MSGSGFSITKDIQEYRVSSVLNNDRKTYGKKFLFDGKEETCWNSDRGSPQWIEFSFPTERTIEKLEIQFQGGFSSKSCLLEIVADTADSDANLDLPHKFEFHPKDSNASQTFIAQHPLTSKKFKLTFVSSYDFYGRITIYCLDVVGK